MSCHPNNVVDLSKAKMLHVLVGSDEFPCFDNQHIIDTREIVTGKLKEAGIKDFTWYCLRHTFSSGLAMTGVEFRTLAELMGHEKRKEFALQLRTK